MCVVIIYRPPTTSVQSFLHDFATYVNEIVATRQNILIVGDLNLLCELIGAHITEPKHMKGHMLDLVITRSSS